MIISIRYVSNQWHWELYSVNRLGSMSDATGKYATGISNTWKEMMAMLEVSVAELETRNETRKE